MYISWSFKDKLSIQVLLTRKCQAPHPGSSFSTYFLFCVEWACFRVLRVYKVPLDLLPSLSAMSDTRLSFLWTEICLSRKQSCSCVSWSDLHFHTYNHLQRFPALVITVHSLHTSKPSCHILEAGLVFLTLSHNPQTSSVIMIPLYLYGNNVGCRAVGCDVMCGSLACT